MTRSGTRDQGEAVALRDIRIRDPYLVVEGETTYLFGTTDEEPWAEGRGVGFDAYRSVDLENWHGPIPVFRPSPSFWATGMFWAPEVHECDGRWYMFATFAGRSARRGTQVLVADTLEGPFEPWSDGPVTPAEWECLDGTLHRDEAGDPWIVYCQEWLQVGDGVMWAQRLSPDLRATVGAPIRLFSASQAEWVAPIQASNGPRAGGDSFITDGPWLHRTKGQALLMLWSSQHADGYAIGVARSTTGRVEGPWVHDREPLWAKDGGHAMVATLADHRQVLVFHQPNESPNERVVLHALVEEGNSLLVRDRIRTDE